MRIYFHILGQGREFRDENGEQFATLQHAKDHAEQIAHELRNDDYQGCEVCAVDGTGVEVARAMIGRLKS